MALLLTLLFCIGILYLLWLDQLSHLRLLFSLAFVVYLAFTVIHTLFIDYKVNYQFEASQCKITQSTVAIQQYQRMTLYLPVFQAELVINNQLASMLVKLNMTEYGLLSSSGAQAVASQYVVGQTYPCWYDPTNYNNIVLEQGWHSGIGTWGITLLAFMIFAVTLYLVIFSM